MAKTGNLNVRIDPDLKSQVHGILEASGLTASAAIDMYYRQIARHNGIPFDIRAPRYNAETMEALQEAKMLVKDKSNYFTSHDDLLEDLET